MIEVVFYLASILAGNLLVHWFGIVKFFGIAFPAGAVAIGITFTARDMVHRRVGDRWVLFYMILATLLTGLFNLQLAIASCAAFAGSELVDYLLYRFLGRSFRQRVVISNLISTPLDSFLFVTLAFGFHWPAIWGQSLIKFGSSLLILPFVKGRNYGLSSAREKML